MSRTALAKRRGSVWGEDGLYYPCEEERVVPLSGAAIRLIFYLYAALRHLLYPKHDEVYVAADQFIYYEPHNPRKNIAPDVWVCYGVPKEPERQVFRTWEEGATPSFVVEVSSEESRAGDRGAKFTAYQDVLRSQEYLIYDEHLNELLLYRREGDVFRSVSPREDGAVYSREVDAWFVPEPGILLRVCDSSGEPVLDVEEIYERAGVAERLQRQLEQEAAQQAQRADALAAEVERLRAELARLRGHARE